MADAIITESAEDGQFYFVVRADNHEVVATSEGYTELRNAVGGLNALVRACLEIAAQGDTKFSINTLTEEQRAAVNAGD